MAKQLRMTFLGGAYVTQGKTPVTGYVSLKALALLCYLAVTGRPHLRPALAGLLWGDQPESSAKTSLRQVLSNLRRLVGPHLLITPHEVAFNRKALYWLDVEEFQAACSRAQSDHPPDAEIDTLRSALDLYQGDFMEGFYVRDAPAFEEWAITQRERFRQMATQALRSLAAHAAARNEYTAAVSYTTRLLALAPWREEAHRQMMLLLARSGQRSAALAQYETCRRTLMEELGVEPMEETTALYQRILAAGTARPHNLPAQATPFIGREEELSQLGRFLADPDCRLLTLVGPGGMGKTRLALRAALEATTEPNGAFLHGIYFVSLAPVISADLLVFVAAQSVGCSLRSAADPKTQLVDYLREKEMLLLLDSLEQVDEAASLVADLLVGCPRLKILATSRTPLHVRGEQQFPVSPLALPDLALLLTGDDLASDLWRSPAVALFADRARAVKPNWRLTSQNAVAVAKICARLDGWPLALELAAARSQSLSPAAMLEQLDSPLALLTNGPRDLPARQQALRATIDWSYHLLNSDEEKLFARLAVFAGGCTAEAVKSVCFDPLASRAETWNQGLLESLQDKSLLQRKEDENAPRFMLLDTIREYALERLAEKKELAMLQGQHAAHYLELAERAEPELRGAEQAVWLDRLEAEHDNLRAALRWAMDNKAIDTALGLGGALWRFWYLRGHLSEGRRWMEAALAASEKADVASKEADVASKEADAADPPARLTLQAKALSGAGTLAYGQSDWSLAMTMLEKALKLWRQIQDKAAIAAALALMGSIVHDHEDYDRSQTLYEEAIALCRQMGSEGRRPLAFALNRLGDIARCQSNPEAARSLHEESLALWQELGDKDGAACALSNLGQLAHTQGNTRRAATLFQQSLKLVWELRDMRGIAESLGGLAVAAGARGQAARSAQLFGQVEALLQSIGGSLDAAGYPEWESGVTAARAQLGEAEFEAAWDAGRAMALEQAVTYALRIGN